MSPAILPFVEGHSEVRSVPVVLRGELERTLELGVRSRSGVGAVMVLVDADDDDPITLEQDLLGRCRKVLRLPCRVVAPCRELEAWFLGGKESLRGVRGIHDDAVAPAGPEQIRGAKEALSGNFGTGSYLEVEHQPTLMHHLDLDLAGGRCPSLQRFRQAVQELVGKMKPGA